MDLGQKFFIQAGPNFSCSRRVSSAIFGLGLENFP